MIQPNSLYHVGCLTLLERIDDGLATTIYLDPPWFGQPLVGEPRTAAQVVGGLREYLDNFARVLQQCHRVLADNGSILVHAKPSLGQKFTLLLGQIFRDNHVDDYILPTFSNNEGPRYAALLHYSKSRGPVLNTLQRYVIESDGEENPDNDPRGPWRAVDLTTSMERPLLQFEWRGFVPPSGRSWRYGSGELDRLAEEGRIHFVERGRLPKLKAYAAEREGVPIGTIWDDMHPVGRSHEGVGYPTQQPVALVERVVQRASNPGDVVIDPYCGSGTSLVAAHRQGRRWIGGDTSPEAIDTVRRRLTSEGLNEGQDWQARSTQDLRALDAKPIFLRRVVTMVEDLNAAEVLIAEGESEWVERKVSAYWNARTQQKDENNKESFIRSVAAFLNSREGGTLLIGVADDGSLPGLIDDYSAANPQRRDRDRYELWLRQILGKRLGTEFAPFIKVSFEEVSGQDVCVVRVAAGSKPAFNDDKLPVRRGNQTVDLSFRDAIEYGRGRWPL